MLLQRKLFLIFGCCPELRNICLLINGFNFISPIFNPMLIIAMPSGEELLKEILTGSTGYKKELVKLF